MFWGEKIALAFPFPMAVVMWWATFYAYGIGNPKWVLGLFASIVVTIPCVIIAGLIIEYVQLRKLIKLSIQWRLENQKKGAERNHD